MIFSTSLRHQPSRRVVETACTFSSPLFRSVRQQRRCLHKVPALPEQDSFAQVGIKSDKGVLLSPKGYNKAWEQQQGWLIAKLNGMVAGSPDENTTAHTLLLKFAREPHRAAAFNYASMIHNHHLFFSTLTNTRKPMTSFIRNKLVESFGSVETFRTTMIAAAMGMFGPGFVWLVMRSDKSETLADTPNFAILNTYLAGSPYAGAHYRMQPVDMNTGRDMVQGGTSPSVYAQDQKSQGRNAAGLQGVRDDYNPTLSKSKMLAPGGVTLQPLLCVSTWEHVWLHDHGIGGKRNYLENWWENINWQQVDANVADEHKQESLRQQSAYPLRGDRLRRPQY